MRGEEVYIYDVADKRGMTKHQMKWRKDEMREGLMKKEEKSASKTDIQIYGVDFHFNLEEE